MSEIIVCADEADYKRLRNKIDAYEAACRNLYGPKKWSFTPEEIAAVGLPYPSNEDRSAVETWEFQHGQADRYVAYVNIKDRVVTTWTGQVVGRITGVGDEWKDSMGGTRVPIDVLGINSVVYHGTYFKSSGNYCRLKAKRHKGSIVVRPL